MTELKQYYRSIEKRLPAGSHKKRFIQELQASVDAWLDQNPSADFGTVQERFGTPEKIAADYSGEIDTQEVMKKFKLRKWIISIIAGVAALALVIWLVVAIVAYINFHDSKNGYIETSPITEEILEENE